MKEKRLDVRSTTDKEKINKNITPTEYVKCKFTKLSNENIETTNELAKTIRPASEVIRETNGVAKVLRPARISIKSVGEVMKVQNEIKNAMIFTQKMRSETVVGEQVIRKAIDSCTTLGLGRKCVGKKTKERHRALVAQAISQNSKV